MLVVISAHVGGMIKVATSPVMATELEADGHLCQDLARVRDRGIQAILHLRLKNLNLKQNGHMMPFWFSKEHPVSPLNANPEPGSQEIKYCR